MSLQRTVAVVDDDLTARKAIQTLLNVHGFSTIGFSSAKDFLHRDAGMQIDCVLLDINLGAQGTKLPATITASAKSDAAPGNGFFRAETKRTK